MIFIKFLQIEYDRHYWGDGHFVLLVGNLLQSLCWYLGIEGFLVIL